MGKKIIFHDIHKFLFRHNFFNTVKWLTCFIFSLHLMLLNGFMLFHYYFIFFRKCVNERNLEKCLCDMETLPILLIGEIFLIALLKKFNAWKKNKFVIWNVCSFKNYECDKRHCHVWIIKTDIIKSHMTIIMTEWMK